MTRIKKGRRVAGAPRMSRYRVVAWWPKQAGFDITVDADSKPMARRAAENAAALCGWEISRPNRIDITKVAANDGRPRRRA
jgi:hypothetical protein